MSKLKMRYTKEEKLQIVKESMEDGVRVEDLAKKLFDPSKYSAKME